MKLVTLLTGLLLFTGDYSGNNRAETMALIEQLKAAYQQENFQFSYQLKTYLKQTVLLESKGKLLKHNDQFYKEMDKVTMVTDGTYAITIDRRIMTIFYRKKNDRAVEQDIVPNLDQVNLHLVSRNESQALIRDRLPNSEMDSTDYLINTKTGLFDLVRHYKTYEGDLYRTDIKYDNRHYNNTPDAVYFDLNQWVDGKGKRAKLSAKGRKVGFTFVNSLQTSN